MRTRLRPEKLKQWRVRGSCLPADTSNLSLLTREEESKLGRKVVTQIPLVTLLGM